MLRTNTDDLGVPTELNQEHSPDGLQGEPLSGTSSTSLAQESSHLPPARRGVAITSNSGLARAHSGDALRRRNRASLFALNRDRIDIEAAPTLESRLRAIADSTVEDVEVAVHALNVVYGKHAIKQPDDVLMSLLERAPIYRKHQITTAEELHGFLSGKSLAEHVAPFVGNMGYMVALSLAGTYVGAHVPSPMTGLPIGGTVMAATIHSGAMRDGLEAYIGQLDTTQLPSSVQARFDEYKKAALPTGIRAEWIRQSTRALVTLVPMLKAIHHDKPMDRAAVVRNDVFADAVTFTAAPYLDEALANLGQSMKEGVQAFLIHRKHLKEKGLETPTHAELLAHQPVSVLEQRLLNYRKSTVDSTAEAFKAMGTGVTQLYAQTPGRLVGVPIQAGFVIAMALIVTSHLIDEDPKNAQLPKGQITPRSSMSVPGALMVMEYLATQAFGTLLGICDAMASRRPAARSHAESGAAIEVIEDVATHERSDLNGIREIQATDDTDGARVRPIAELPLSSGTTPAAPKSSTTGPAISETQSDIR